MVVCFLHCCVMWWLWLVLYVVVVSAGGCRDHGRGGDVGGRWWQ